MKRKISYIIDFERFTFYKIVFIFCFFYYFTSFSQNSEWGSPLDIPLLLSGNFGELRPNHFHTGLDLKTQGKEGLNVYAVKEGYVSRIRVGLYGYGKAIYITHPNGLTSVYAHLQKFSPVIEAYIKKIQYARKSFEVETFPKPSELLVKKGEIIGLSGNTGGSAGPHLHFEIRDASAKGTNPLLYGYEIKDDIQPDVYQVVAYSIGQDSQIEQSQLPRQINISKQPDGSFLGDKIFANGVIAFGVQAFDKQNNTYHQNGVYKVTMSLNGTPRFQYIFDKLNFDEARYINTFIDYQLLSEKKSRVQLLHKTSGNKLTDLYSINKNDGKLEIKDGMSYIATILVEDFKGNTTKIELPIEGKKQEIKEFQPTPKGKKIIASRDNFFTFENGEVYFPENTFYEDFFIELEGKGDTISVHNPSVAVHKMYTISMANQKFKENELSQVFIANISEKNSISAEKTTYKNGVFTAKTRNLGKFSLMKDTIPPILKPLNFKENSEVKSSVLKVEIKDFLSGIASYSASLNGQWVLFEYEPKTRTLTFDFSDIDTKKTTDYKLEMTAKDGVGNVQKLEVSFKKK